MSSTLRAPLRAERTQQHAVAIARLAAPLAVAQLAQMAMGITDTILLGQLGNDALAAGGLGATLFFTAIVLLQGVLTAVSVMVSQARGAGRDDAVPGLYWTGMALTLLLSIVAFALFSLLEPILLAIGEPAGLARDTARYTDVLRWGAPGAMLAIGLMRAFLPAVGQGSMLLYVSLGAAVLNGVLCYGLIHGAWGLPAMGLEGAALASVLVFWAAAAALLLAVHLRPGLVRFVAWCRPDGRSLVAMLRLGLPVSGTFAVEAGLFVGVGLMIGLLGPAPLAAQQIALSVTSVAFMIPLAIAQAANVRVGNRYGAADGPGARRAGLVAIGMGAVAELLAAAILLLAPGTVVGTYLDGTVPANAEAFAIAITLVRVATVFLLVDGIQCVAAGALRGLGDTRVPFLLAALGYWGLGFPAAWWLAMRGGWGAPGAWMGMGAGLLIVAALLTWRSHRRSLLTPASIPRP